MLKQQLTLLLLEVLLVKVGRRNGIKLVISFLMLICY
jgi:hypothetical protein